MDGLFKKRNYTCTQRGIEQPDEERSRCHINGVTPVASLALSQPKALTSISCKLVVLALVSPGEITSPLGRETKGQQLLLGN